MHSVGYDRYNSIALQYLLQQEEGDLAGRVTRLDDLGYLSSLLRSLDDFPMDTWCVFMQL